MDAFCCALSHPPIPGLLTKPAANAHPPSVRVRLLPSHSPQGPPASCLLLPHPPPRALEDKRVRVNWEQNEGQHRPVLRYGWDVCEMVIQVQQIRQGHMLPVSTLTPCREPDQRPCVPSAGVLSPMSPLGLPWIWRPLDQPAYSPAREAGRAVGWWERGPAYPGYGCGPIGIPSLRNTGHQRHRVSLGKQTPSQFLPSKINTSHLRELGKPRNMKDNRNIKRKKGQGH